MDSHVRSTHLQGVGTALLEWAAAESICKGQRSLFLHVSSKNGGAKRLYERQGFTVIQDSTNCLTGCLTGEPGFLYMEKPLMKAPGGKHGIVSPPAVEVMEVQPPH
eukprot:CAMPEP_0117680890 /NCGR_PEP_ID=MMETSP0804-20121206/18626_1 /TAXON_ID=1074897 /ORGANISM="Tetraselmis astigmatica, Strain CCMP880" /LENGTH=105 /DNA_ID=CAMNT_0005490483 /DNA_START=313 /DNA_END=630 /DNA_ORIENTATION=-